MVCKISLFLQPAKIGITSNKVNVMPLIKPSNRPDLRRRVNECVKMRAVLPWADVPAGVHQVVQLGSVLGCADVPIGPNS